MSAQVYRTFSSCHPIDFLHPKMQKIHCSRNDFGDAPDLPLRPLPLVFSWILAGALGIQRVYRTRPNEVQQIFHRRMNQDKLPKCWSVLLGNQWKKKASPLIVQVDESLKWHIIRKVNKASTYIHVTFNDADSIARLRFQHAQFIDLGVISNGDEIAGG